MITGLNHITISVKDLAKSYAFYSDVLGFKPLMKHSKGAYFLAGDLWFCIEQDSSTRLEPLSEYTHFAFSVSQSDFVAMMKQIDKFGAKIWKQNVSEGDSIYFLDPDGHKLELHVGNWRSRIESIRKKPWNDSVEIMIQSKDHISAISVRPARPDESRSLSGLAMRSKSYWPYPRDYLEKCYRVLHVTEYDIKSWPVCVAEQNREVIGFFALKPIKDENRLDHLWIDPRFINKGVGKILFKEAITAAKYVGWTGFRLAADPYAEPFYLKMGAKNIGVVQSKIKPDLFLPHMELLF